MEKLDLTQGKPINNSTGNSLNLSQGKPVSGTAVTPTPPAPKLGVEDTLRAKGGYGNEMVANEVAGAKKIAGSIQKGGQEMAYNMPTASRARGDSALKGLGGFLGGAFDAVTGTVSGLGQIVTAPIAPAVGAIVSKYAEGVKKNNPEMMDFINKNIAPKVSEAIKAHPEAAERISNGLDTLMWVYGGGEAEKPLKDAVGDAGLKSLTEKSLELSTTAGDKSIIKSLDNAIKDATPSYSEKIIKQPGIRNEAGEIVSPRVSESKGLGGRKVNPTNLEVDAGNALNEIPNYPSKGTYLQKYQSVYPEIQKEGEALTTSLSKEAAKRTPQQIENIVQKAVEKVPDNSLLLGDKDPAIANYLRVTKNAAKLTDGTLAGELKVEQALDTAYENARGSLAYGDSKIAALDEVHTAARDALREDMIAAAKDTKVQDSIKKQWDLFRAQDVLRQKAEQEAGTMIGRFIQKNPIKSKIIEKGAKAAGMGTGIELLK